ncbi:MAG: hypothetical protein ACFFD9_00410 [Candidatus Thorarchaeota archaeon]
MNKYAIALIVLACVTSIVRFGHVYPDSQKYLDYIEYFDGEGGIEDVPAPFALRPVMPFVVSLLNGIGDSFLILSTLNVFFVCLIGLGIYRYVRSYSIDEKPAFYAAAICTASFPVAFYGAVPLVDALAVLVMVAVVIGMMEGLGDWFAMTMLLLGVIVKEIVLFIGLYYVLREGVKRIWVLVPASVLHLVLRFLIFGELSNTLVFNLNIFDRLFEVVGVTGISFALPVTILLIRIRNDKCQHWKSISKDTFLGIFALLPLVLLGLFFAYFDARFLWPLYLPLAPMIACSLTTSPEVSSSDSMQQSNERP